MRVVRGHISHRPTDWHILDLDKDSNPGDPQRVKNFAGSLHGFADDVSRVSRDIKSMAPEDPVLMWAGRSRMCLRRNSRTSPAG